MSARGRLAKLLVSERFRILHRLLESVGYDGATGMLRGVGVTRVALG